MLYAYYIHVPSLPTNQLHMVRHCLATVVNESFCCFFMGDTRRADPFMVERRAELSIGCGGVSALKSITSIVLDMEKEEDDDEEEDDNNNFADVGCGKHCVKS